MFLYLQLNPPVKAMHFWIDKRSQQCGFGRSRVAASLSHAGSGLSYGHPPRRAKSTSCSGNSTVGGSGQTMPSVHRSLPQAPYDLHQPGTSRQSHSHSQYANNNANMLQQHSSGGTSNNNNLHSSHHVAATGAPTTASNNNNAASSAAVLTGSGTIVPLVARGSHYQHHGSTRYAPRPQQQQQLLHQHSQQQQQQQHSQQQHQHPPQQQQQHYSYHHPQFGNMAVPVRHYDAHQQQQYSGNVYA